MTPHLPPLGTITAIRVRPLNLKIPFTQFAAHFADQRDTVVLLSGGDLDCARHHLLGVKPWLGLRGGEGNLHIQTQGRDIIVQGNPFDTLDRIIDHYQKMLPVRTDSPASLPLGAGLMGYLSYDLKDYIEDLPRTSIDDLSLPTLCLYAHKALVIHDKKTSRTWLSITVHENDTKERI